MSGTNILLIVVNCWSIAYILSHKNSSYLLCSCTHLIQTFLSHNICILCNGHHHKMLNYSATRKWSWAKTSWARHLQYTDNTKCHSGRVWTDKDFKLYPFALCASTSIKLALVSKWQTDDPKRSRVAADSCYHTAISAVTTSGIVWVCVGPGLSGQQVGDSSGWSAELVSDHIGETGDTLPTLINLSSPCRGSGVPLPLSCAS